MVILHNSNDKYSRLFVRVYGDSHTVIDWYKDDAAREVFKAEHPQVSPSAFPCVLVFVPAYSDTDIEGNFHDVPARHELYAMPESIAEVEVYEAAASQRAISNPPVNGGA